MKLGTETNSVINHLHARGTKGQPTPEVGMGATILAWTDRYAATIVSVERKGEKTIIGVQGDKATVIAGSTFDGTAEYAYAPNPAATIEYYRADTPDSAWRRVRKNDNGRWVLAEGNGLRIGARDEYRDPSF